MFNLRFEPANKVNKNLAMHNRLRVAMSGGKIKIYPNCVRTRYQLKNGVFNQKGTDYLRTDKTGHLDLTPSKRIVKLLAPYPINQQVAALSSFLFSHILAACGNNAQIDKTV